MDRDACIFVDKKMTIFYKCAIVNLLVTPNTLTPHTSQYDILPIDYIFATYWRCTNKF